MKNLMLAIILLVISSCASLVPSEDRQTQWEDKLRSWVGSTETDLIQSWGVPIDAYTTSGSKFIEYIFVTNGVGHTCTVTFTIVEDQITYWTWKSSRRNSCWSWWLAPTNQ